MMQNQARCLLFPLLLVISSCLRGEVAAAPQPAPPIRVLLIGQSPDSHPRGTHEYMTGIQIVQHLLGDVPELQLITARADEPWTEGPAILQTADAAFLFVSEGAKWLSADEHRLDAFQQLAQRGGGLCCWHWGMGSRDAQPVTDFTALFGACHGGPDRQYKVLETTVSLPSPSHAVVHRLSAFDLKEEFYFALKRHPGAQLTPLLTIPIDGRPEMVCWAWDRPDGGRSFGFSGGHFHALWARPEYRRLAAQGLLWTIGHEDAADRIAMNVPQSLLAVDGAIKQPAVDPLVKDARKHC